jgi:hypothetical protein
MKEEGERPNQFPLRGTLVQIEMRTSNWIIHAIPVEVGGVQGGEGLRVPIKKIMAGKDPSYQGSVFFLLSPCSPPLLEQEIALPQWCECGVQQRQRFLSVLSQQHNPSISGTSKRPI